MVKPTKMTQGLCHARVNGSVEPTAQVERFLVSGRGSRKVASIMERLPEVLKRRRQRVEVGVWQTALDCRRPLEQRYGVFVAPRLV